MTNLKMPTRYQYELVTKLAGEGWRVKDIAHAIGFSERTFYRHLKDDEQLALSFDQGRGVEHQQLVASLFQRAINPTNAQGAAAAMFLLKTRHSYREQGPIEREGTRVAVVVNVPAPLTPKQYEKLIEVRPGLGANDARPDAEVVDGR